MRTSSCRRPPSGSGATSTRPGAAPATTRSSCARRSSRCTSAATTWTSARTWPSGSGSTATSAWTTSSGCARSAPAPTSTTSTPSASAGLARLPAPEEAVAFAREVRDPARPPVLDADRARSRSTRPRSQPIPTRTVSARIPAIPTWIPPHEGDPRHPLELISPKSRARTHSIHDNQPTLARVDKQDVWIHPEDAAARGIADGQPVRVFNDRGATMVPARVTDRIARGVVVDQGRRLVHSRARRARTRGAAPTCSRRTAPVAVRRADLQHLPRRGRVAPA